jgi:hypothetical protein
MKVRYKKTSQLVRIKSKHVKPFFSTVAAAFKTYNDSLTKADLLFEAFSPERLQAQQVALDKLQNHLNNLNLRQFVKAMYWEEAYNYPTRYQDAA